MNDIEYLNSQIEKLNDGQLTETDFSSEVMCRLGYTEDEVRVIVRNMRRIRPVDA